MSKRLEISLLGGFTVALDGRLIRDFESDKARALMAFLVTEPERPLRREKLAGLLWPDLPERRARRNLSQTLYSLRKALGDTTPAQTIPAKPIFLATVQEIQLNRDGQTRFDVAAFRTGRLGCDRHVPKPGAVCSACLNRQSEAVALYRGDFLAGFSLPACAAFEEWLLIERERFRRQALSTLMSLAISCRRRGDPVTALGHARRAAALDPLWEPAQREVMQALWLTGHRAEALDQYTDYSKHLANELGLEPDELTRKLAGRIRTDSEIISPSPVGGHNLPYSLTPFIGRAQDVAQIQACLEDQACRLLTLLGPGGCGKSRLAIEAVRPLLADFPDGLFLLSLSGLDQTAALVPAMVDLFDLRLPPDREPKSQVLDYLQAKRMLLILDSCEALPEVADLAVSILHRAPGVKILATSRGRLNLKAETVYQLSGLTFASADAHEPAWESDAARLFISAALRLRPDYEPDAADKAGIVKICRLAQGMPLAIILATAWLELLTPADIAAAMAENLDFLAVEWPDLPERQRSLRSTLAYTWRLLTPPQQTTFAALSVFRGGFSAAAAAHVADAAPRDLLEFLHRSLLQRTGADRYSIHDLMRQFAAEKLVESPAALRESGRRHSDFYLGCAKQWAGDLQSEQQAATLTVMDSESRNLTAAWSWAVGQGALATLDQALTGLGLYGEIRGRFEEGAAACAVAAKLGEDRPEIAAFQAKALIWQARLLRLAGKVEPAGKALAAARQQAEYLKPTTAMTSSVHAFLCLELGDANLHSDRDAAFQWYEQSQTLFVAAGVDWWVAKAQLGLGEACHLVGRFAEAQTFYEQALATCAQLADPRSLAAAHIGLGNNCFRLGRFDEGEHQLQAAIHIFETLGEEGPRATGLFNLARFNWWHGHFQQSLEYVDQALPIFRNLGMRHDQGFAAVGRAYFYTHLGNYEEGQAAAEAGLIETENLGFPRWRAFARLVMGAAMLGLGHYVEAHGWLREAATQFREIDQFEDLASTLALAGAAALHGDDAGPARAGLAEAVALCLETRGLWAAMHALPVSALYLAMNGHLEAAIEIASLADRYPQIKNSHLFADEMIRPVLTLAQSLPAGVTVAARERGEALDLWPALAHLHETLTAAAAHEGPLPSFAPDG